MQKKSQKRQNMTMQKIINMIMAVMVFTAMCNATSSGLQNISQLNLLMPILNGPESNSARQISYTLEVSIDFRSIRDMKFNIQLRNDPIQPWDVKYDIYHPIYELIKLKKLNFDLEIFWIFQAEKSE